MSARMHGFGVTLLLAASASLLLAACTRPVPNPRPRHQSQIRHLLLKRRWCLRRNPLSTPTVPTLRARRQ